MKSKKPRKPDNEEHSATPDDGSENIENAILETQQQPAPADERAVEPAEDADASVAQQNDDPAAAEMEGDEEAIEHPEIAVSDFSTAEFIEPQQAPNFPAEDAFVVPLSMTAPASAAQMDQDSPSDQVGAARYHRVRI